MMILFVVLSFVMVFILIWQQIQHKKLVREIDYITSRLDTCLLYTSRISKINNPYLFSFGWSDDVLMS